MDEEEIKALIAEQVGTALQNADIFKPLADQLSQDVQRYMSDLLTPLEGRLDGLENAVTTPDPKDKPDDKDQNPTDKRLALLEQQLAESTAAREAEKAEREALEFDSHLTGVLQEFNPQFAAEAKQLLRGQLGATKRDGDRYLTPDGKTVQEAATAFFDTPVGKHFLPSQAANGMGTAAPKETAEGSGKPDISKALLSAFG